jgi:hypothetical protein
MELNVNNSTDSGRIKLTADELERLRPAAEKFAKEKLDCIIANHSPEYWENYWNAVKRRRMRL